MMFSKPAILAFAIAAVHAQSNSSTTVDPGSVDLSDRSSWCNGQINTCGTLCGGDTNKNDCDPATLDFDCSCTANNSAPGLQYYTQTIPYFICEKTYENCIVSGANNAAAQRLCTQTRESNCGTLSPDDFEEASPSSTSESPSSTASRTSSSTTGSATETDTESASSVFKVNGELGFGMILAAVFGYFL